MDLVSKRCVPCEAGVPKLEGDEIDRYVAHVPLWTVRHDAPPFGGEVDHLHRSFRFDSFASALAFLNRVAALAEEERHHPDLTLHGWDRLDVTIHTHAIGGLSENDFILAKKIDRLAA